MTTFRAPVSRFLLNLTPAAVAAAGWVAFAGPACQAAPLPPLTNVHPSAPAPGAGGPKRPGPVIAPATDPAEASLRQGGPHRPGLIPSNNLQPTNTETAERLGQP